ncbi:twin-arginine translocase TatA/TatE family subunit [Leucobacter allii]|uniref:Sec-independent protein translocase protein TatA n=1 Tax=Leucobacter allii TaxID=2932247 RepID=A0ABY4FK07_9MICO|nr:twin-arginine translocase TatA/TatE family subunit [Leucobacter allii]UOQ56502.1 twin-arginine translocase TatA/TatE family subunit [Leucobacter allii]
MFGNLSGPTLLVILFIVLLLFGAPKLPGLAKSLGQSMRILKKEVGGKNGEADAGADEAAQSGAAPDTAPRASAPEDRPASSGTRAERPDDDPERPDKPAN